MTLPTHPNKHNGFLTAAWAVLAVGLAVPLVIYILTGFHTRYLADDYCTAAIYQRYGWWGMQVQSYQNITLYAGNRFSLTLLVSLGDLFGPRAVAVYPGIMLLLWVGGLVFLLRGLRPGGRKPDWLPVLAVSELVVWLAITAAPNRFQVLYWRQAMLPYLAPFPFGAWLAGLIIRQGRARSAQPFTWLGIGALGLLAGGLSETGVAVLLPAGFLALIGAAVATRMHPKAEGHLLQGAAAGFLGLLIAFILLVAAPMNLERMSFYTERLSLPEMVRMTWQEGWLGFRMFLWEFPSSFLLLVVLCAAAGFAHGISGNKTGSWDWKLHLAGWLFLPLLILMFSLAASAPAVFAQGSGPEPRARFVTLGVVITGWAWFGLEAGWLASQWTWLRQRRWFTPLLAGAGIFTLLAIYVINPAAIGENNLRDLRAVVHPRMVLAAVLAPLAGMTLVFRINRGRVVQISATAVLAAGVMAAAAVPVLQSPRLIPDYEQNLQRAAAWDERDASIRAAAAQGVQSLTIPALDSVAGVVELREESYWVNNCAEWYYGIPVIEAKEMQQSDSTP